MNEHLYDEAKTEGDIDEVTRVRINQLFGNIDEEFKVHRQAILAIATLLWGEQSKSMTKERAEEKVKGLLKINEEIEKIIEDGKAIKKLRGF